MSKQKNIEQYQRIRDDLSCNIYPTKVDGILCSGIHNIKSPLSKPSIHLHNRTSVDAALNCDSEKSVGLLIFASGTRHGGGASSGAVAQEESIMRTTSWSDVRVPRAFFRGTAPFYTDDVVIADGYIFYNDDYVPIEPRCITFLSSAAPNLNVEYNTHILTNVIRSKMRNILKAAESQKIQTCILGAYGCGVFKGDPEMYAQCWTEVIEEGWYSGTIIFAIPNQIMLDIFHKQMPFSIVEDDLSLKI